MGMPKINISFITLLLLSSESLSALEDPNVLMITNSCTNCHGMDGVSTEGIPTIAGLPKNYVITKLQGYRDNSIQGTIMNRIMEQLNDYEITILANHYSRLNNQNAPKTAKSNCGQCHERKISIGEHIPEQ
ncbi:Cytochrome subunit of sulfide dehydrogenase [compost metagenome]|jgi:cytochrome c553